MGKNMNTLDEIVALAKRRGFVYPTSEIYGGLVSSYDYGPNGVELLSNIKQLWWKEFIQKRDDMVGLDSQIMLHPQTWVASGHVSSFADPMVEDSISHKRYRADHLIEAWAMRHPEKLPADFKIENLTIEEMGKFIENFKILSPDGNKVSAPKKFNLLFETQIGVVVGDKATVYLRGETAQGIFSNFKNVLDSNRVRLPFGIGQIGKSFRNEITSGQFVFRTLEFEQAEIEYFFDPETSDWKTLLKSWQDAMWQFVTKTLGINSENLRWRQHTDTERSHYSKDTYDLEYKFPFGWKELWGVAYRTDYDLKQHAQFSGKNLMYKDPVSGKEFVPHVIEPAVGLNRLFLMILADCITVEEKRTVLKLDPKLAPHTVAVFPLVANKPELIHKARAVYNLLKQAEIKVAWDERGNIGKRYLSQDEVGTPWCVTIDYDTLNDESVTIRDRDTTKQERVKIAELATYIQEKIC
jgi:glycyl-tRNA synthetase